MKFVIFSNRKARGLLALLIGVLLLLFAIPHFTHAANDFSYSVAAVYQVHSDATTRVEETYTVTNNVDNRYLDSIQLSTPVDDATNISVEYADGTSVPFTTELKKSTEQGYSFDYDQIKIKFTRPNNGRGVSWKFVVSYDTNKLVETQGSAHTVNVPAVPQDDNNTYTVQLNVPENFGTLHTTGVKPESLGTSRGITSYKYTKKEQLAKSVSLVFGDSTVYEANFNFPLHNDSNFGATFTVTLPPNTSGQKVIVQSLDPQPKTTHLDPDGNILADYDVAPHTNVTVTTNVIAVVSYQEYNLAASGTKADIPKDLVERYTKPQRYWPADNPEVVAKAQQLVAGKKTVAEQVRAINEFVVNDLTYNSDKIKYNIRQGGLKALQNPGNAVCLEYSDVSISLLRAAGIPARMPIGYGYSGSLKQSSSVTDSLHSWVQAYVPGIGWMNVDPTWGEKFNNFGSSDLDHFAFAIWGTSDNSPTAVMQNGADTNYQYENTTISYKTVPPNLLANGKMMVQKWLILPLFAIARFDVQAPSDTAGDDYVIRTRQGTKIGFVDFGALAPQQKATRIIPVFGVISWGVLNADFTQSGNTSLILASAKVSAQSWPMWIILVVIAGVIAAKLIQSIIAKRKKKKEDEETVLIPMPTVTSALDHEDKDQKEPHDSRPPEK